MTALDHLTETRTAYDTVATDYAELTEPLLADMPFGRAAFTTFAELVLADGSGTVVDIGCGPGWNTAYLHSLGLNVFGIDLSPGAIAIASRNHPELRFDVGSMLDLDLPTGALGGILAWYSIIHTPLAELPRVFAEFHRVLAPGGRLLLGFQIGEECVHHQQAYGHEVSLHAYRLSPDHISNLAREADLPVHATLLRDPAGDYEKASQATLFARKPL